MLCALIMAGGKGERFWPLSSEEKPKQFLNLIGEDTMIQMTVKRLEKLIPIERIFVVTAQRYTSLVKQQLPSLPIRNIIIEPVGKNTAPCIGLSAFVINKYYEDSTIAVLPSDHLIQNEDIFRNILDSSYQFVNNNSDSIITIGIRPNRPETGYGYIKYGITAANINGFDVNKVYKFVEKPNLEMAKEYIANGDFLWNGGMFIWKCSTILKLTKQYLNETYNILKEIAVANDEEFEQVLEDKYSLVKSISIDYAIMEKSDNIFVIPSDFGWDDLGNWTSLERYREKDSDENVGNDNCAFYRSKGNIVTANKKILLNNVDDLIIVETSDYIMISSKNHEQEIKEAKKMLI